MPTVLSLRNLTLGYDHAVAVDDLCLEVHGGEIFGLLGPNGSGKSSTLSAIAGNLSPRAGDIRVAGIAEREQPLAYRRLLGLVPQELALFQDLSAEDNLLFFGRLYGLKGRTLQTRVASALEFVRLAEYARARPSTFSGGMQRRLNLACALLHEPVLLLLDEPTVGLDPQSRETIFNSLRTLRDRGCALIFTTHHLEEAEQLCDRVGIMARGQLLALGTLEDLSGATPAGYVWPDPSETNTESPAPDPIRRAGLVRKERAVETRPKLEQVFLELTGRSLREP
jgi:ABC-2 type transport system ATP-binding protein